MNKAIIHIGMDKTGTTAIQSYCNEHRAFLLSHGWFYPRGKGDNFFSHIDFAAQHGFLWNENATEQTSAVAELGFDEYPTFQPDQLLLSSECFCQYSDVRPIYRLKEWLVARGFEAQTIVVYLRNQADWLVSLYGESIKWGSTSTISEFYDAQRDRMFRSTLLAQWSDVFGLENMQVRSYDNCHGNVLVDFVETVLAAEAGVVRHVRDFVPFFSNSSTSQILLENIRSSKLETDPNELFAFLYNTVLRKAPVHLKDLFRRRIWKLPEAFLAELDAIEADNELVTRTYGLAGGQVTSQWTMSYMETVREIDPAQVATAAMLLHQDLALPGHFDVRGQPEVLSAVRT